MINKKLNKKRRLQAFRKLFVNNEKYSYISWNNCILGQMAGAIGLRFDIFEPSREGFNLEVMNQVSKFFGLDTQLLFRVMFEATTFWKEILNTTEYTDRSHATAVKVLDALIAQKG